MTGDKGRAQDIVLRLDRITKRFGPLVANDAISVTLARGEVVALLGENGAGKTTLMNILFGHYTADEGRVEAFGQPLPPGQPRAALAAGIGMVHQHFTLADNLSVIDNIRLGTERLLSWGAGQAAARARIAERTTGKTMGPNRRVETQARPTKHPKARPNRETFPRSRWSPRPQLPRRWARR